MDTASRERSPEQWGPAHSRLVGLDRQDKIIWLRQNALRASKPFLQFLLRRLRRRVGRSDSPGSEMGRHARGGSVEWARITTFDIRIARESPGHKLRSTKNAPVVAP